MSTQADLKQYLVITGNYWSFTLTDGALRMLVVLYFHQLGYSALSIAMLFLLYEFFGIVTNLVGGWLGARIGLNRTMHIGLSVQIVALAMLLLPAALLTIPWVMVAQALSGIAKDLNKMSAKSSVKSLVKSDQQSTLFKWVAILTGSKNTLKGVGFFLGGALLSVYGFHGALLALMLLLAVTLVLSLCLLKGSLGKAKSKAKFSSVFSTSKSVNYLSAARLFLFGARDVWFVVALPVYLHSVFDWDFWQVGTFMACWVIVYGMVQAAAPWITGKHPDGRAAHRWAFPLALVPLAIAILLPIEPQWILVGGLVLFGVLFAINSSLHSYLIVSYAKQEAASMDIGFYYMSNAAGRLIGTLLSGWLFQRYGIEMCLFVSAAFLIASCLIALVLPSSKQTVVS